MAIHLNRSGVLWTGVLLLLRVSVPVAAHNGAVAIAVPVEGVTLDGDAVSRGEGMRVQIQEEEKAEVELTAL